MFKLIFLLIPFLLFSKAVKVDEILTEERKFKLDSYISYSNINRKSNVVLNISYQTQNGDFVNIPTYIGNSKSN